MRKNNISGCFPWAMENFNNYFPATSAWVKCPPEIEEWYFEVFKENLTAAGLHRHSRLIQDSYERENFLKPYNWNALSLRFENYSYLAGNVDLSFCDVCDVLTKDKYVICHEPFNYVFPDILNQDFDYTVIAPDSEIFEKELIFVKELSFGLPSVGLHVRRGDYKQWKSGSFYYHDDFWLELAFKKINSGFRPWVFTNEIDDDFLNQLADLGAIVLKADFETEFLRFMSMDQIIGPPSTFSFMAANIAKKAFGREIVYMNLPEKHKISDWMASYFSKKLS